MEFSSLDLGRATPLPGWWGFNAGLLMAPASRGQHRLWPWHTRDQSVPSVDVPLSRPLVVHRLWLPVCLSPETQNTLTRRWCSLRAIAGRQHGQKAPVCLSWMPKLRSPCSYWKAGPGKARAWEGPLGPQPSPELSSPSAPEVHVWPLSLWICGSQRQAHRDAAGQRVAGAALQGGPALIWGQLLGREQDPQWVSWVSLHRWAYLVKGCPPWAAVPPALSVSHPPVLPPTIGCPRLLGLGQDAAAAALAWQRAFLRSSDCSFHVIFGSRIPSCLSQPLLPQGAAGPWCGPWAEFCSTASSTPARPSGTGHLADGSGEPCRAGA